jgi:hypothetical protein
MGYHIPAIEPQDSAGTKERHAAEDPAEPPQDPQKRVRCWSHVLKLQLESDKTNIYIQKLGFLMIFAKKIKQIGVLFSAMALNNAK